nr:MAG TPA: antitoxin [Caudoviricetes sp.]
MEKRTSHIHIKIAPSVKEAAQKLAEENSRTLSNYVESLLLREIEKAHEPKN